MRKLGHELRLHQQAQTKMTAWGLRQVNNHTQISADCCLRISEEGTGIACRHNRNREAAGLHVWGLRQAPENAERVSPMAACLLAEAGRVADVFQRQVCLLKPLLPVHCAQWLLRCGNEVLVFSLTYNSTCLGLIVSVIQPFHDIAFDDNRP